MNRINKRTYLMYIFAVLFLAGIVILFFTMQINSGKWVIKTYNKHLYNKGEIIAAGTITDRYGVVLAETKNGERVFNESAAVREATLHVVGDTGGFISTGIHSSMKSNLTGYSLINGVYTIKKKGTGNDVQLSIDSRLSVDALKALGDYKGTIGVYNYVTGEIYCAVSNPTYDVLHKPDDIMTDTTGKYEGIYMNRFFTGLYTPGSTFKLVTSTCAIDNILDIDNRTFSCDGAWTNKVGSKVNCTGHHGHPDFKTALAHSCNSSFAAIAVELGKTKMGDTAAQCGFNKSIKVDNFYCAKSKFDVSKAYDIDLAWAGIGQYTTLVNPCHEITLIGAIANKNGTAPTPTLIKGNRTDNLNYMGSVAAKKLYGMMRNNVTSYYKDSSFPGLQMAGKTGTAEVANKRPNAWFVGFSQRDDLPLAIVVVCEDAGSAPKIAIPIANKVMQKALDYYVKAYAKPANDN